MPKETIQKEHTDSAAEICCPCSGRGNLRRDRRYYLRPGPAGDLCFSHRTLALPAALPASGRTSYCVDVSSFQHLKLKGHVPDLRNRTEKRDQIPLALSLW